MLKKKRPIPYIAAAFGAGIILCFVLPVKVLLFTSVILFIAALIAK